MFWGYQAFMVMAGVGYLFGITQGKEYAEPEWYADLWLTIVWVSYIIVYIVTLARRKESHIYVANWFFLAFMIVVAILHLGNNMSIPVSMTSPNSISVFGGVQTAMIQWWYCHNEVGFFCRLVSSALCIILCPRELRGQYILIVFQFCISGVLCSYTSGLVLITSTIQLYLIGPSPWV